MSRCIAIVLILLISLTSSRDLITLIDFSMHQDYIAQNVCANRFKPELMCSGKCVLNESLSLNHENEEHKPPLFNLDERTIYMIPAVEHMESYILPRVPKESIAYETNFYAFDFLKEIFHPPTSVS